MVPRSLELLIFNLDGMPGFPRSSRPWTSYCNTKPPSGSPFPPLSSNCKLSFLPFIWAGVLDWQRDFFYPRRRLLHALELQPDHGGPCFGFPVVPPSLGPVGRWLQLGTAFPLLSWGLSLSEAGGTFPFAPSPSLTVRHRLGWT